MAIILPPSGEAGEDKYQPLAEINVTPMVDVMLVLLVIFMITAPLLQVGVPVDLPKTSAQQVGGKDEPLVVSVNAKDEIFLGETRYEPDDLATKLKAVHDEKPDQRVFIRGDKTINYGRMMQVMGIIIDSGFRQLGLLGEQGDSAPAKPAAPARR
jgi:biopolymer transport protein TolR